MRLSKRRSTLDVRNAPHVTSPADPGAVFLQAAPGGRSVRWSRLLPSCLPGLSGLPAMQKLDRPLEVPAWEAIFERLANLLPGWATSLTAPGQRWRLLLDPAATVGLQSDDGSPDGKWPARGRDPRGFGRHPCLQLVPQRGVKGVHLNKKKGYVQVQLTTSVREAAHRLVCAACHGPPPTPCSLVMHLCDNPTCVAPSHLGWGSSKSNHYLNGADHAYWSATRLKRSRLKTRG